MLYESTEMHTRHGWPPELPRSAAGTHLGMFVGWALTGGLGQWRWIAANQATLDAFARREITPGVWFTENIGGRFTSDMLSREGAGFTDAYCYEDTRCFLDDYLSTWPENYPSLVHAPDSWDAYERLAPVMSRRLDEWRTGTGHFSK